MRKPVLNDLEGKPLLPLEVELVNDGYLTPKLAKVLPSLTETLIPSV